MMHDKDRNTHMHAHTLTYTHFPELDRYRGRAIKGWLKCKAFFPLTSSTSDAVFLCFFFFLGVQAGVQLFSALSQQESCCQE